MKVPLFCLNSWISEKLKFRRCIRQYTILGIPICTYRAICHYLFFPQKLCLNQIPVVKNLNSLYLGKYNLLVSFFFLTLILSACFLFLQGLFSLMIFFLLTTLSLSPLRRLSRSFLAIFLCSIIRSLPLSLLFGFLLGFLISPLLGFPFCFNMQSISGTTLTHLSRLLKIQPCANPYCAGNQHQSGDQDSDKEVFCFIFLWWNPNWFLAWCYFNTIILPRRKRFCQRGLLHLRFHPVHFFSR